MEEKSEKENGEASAIIVDEEAEKSNLYLEGGWGWMVVLGSMITHFIVVGTPRSFGVLYEELLVRYEGSALETSLIMAICNTMRMVLGPLASALCNKYGCKIVVFIGGIIVSTGWTVSAFSTGIFFLYFSLSVLAGIGAAMIFTPSYIIVSQYFNKKKGKAMSISTVGSGLGNVAMAPFIAFLLQTYSYTGAMLIIGGFMLNNCVAAALFRNVEDNYPKRKMCKEKCSTENASLSTEKQSVGHRMRLKSGSSITSQLKTIGKWTKVFVVLKNMTFLIYGVQITAMAVCIQTFLTFLPSLAKETIGASDTMGALLLSIAGASDMVGRLIIGFPMDHKSVRYRRRLFHAILGIPVAAFCILTGAAQSYAVMIFFTVIFGMTAGAFHSQRATIVTEFVPKEQMPNTVGFVIFFQGFGNVLGPPAAGYMRDTLGTYSIGYYYAGTCLAITSLAFIANYYYVQRKATQSARENGLVHA